MGWGKGKTRAGSGGKRGHSNMDHWLFNDEEKEYARRRARLEGKEAVRAATGEAQVSDDPRTRIRELLATAEAALDKMYDARTRSDADWQFSLAKDLFRAAVRKAEEAGLTDEAQRIMARLVDVKAAHRSQF
jgi:hypothetical protein